MSPTFFDFSIFGLIAFFALIGLMRGFVREVFSIANWVLASIVTIYLRPIISNFILIKINIPIVADLISNSFLFTTSLILISIVTSNLARGIHGKFPIVINLFFGLGFGIIKGFLLSSLIFAIIVNVYGSKDQTEPTWFAESVSYKPLSFGATFIKPFTDSLFGSLSEENHTPQKSNDKKANSGDNPFKVLDMLKNRTKELEGMHNYDKPKSTNGTKDPNGYNSDQIKKMNRLIDTIAD